MRASAFYFVVFLGLACGPGQKALDASVESTSETGDSCPQLVWSEGGELRITSAEGAAALPPYTIVDGPLRIDEVPGLTDLVFLGCLEEIRGDLYIGWNPDLETLVGLERLASFGFYGDYPGGLDIHDNPKLRSLEGLSGLEYVDWIRIQDNTSLESLEGLEHLKATGKTVIIEGNDSLRTIGLRSLESVDDLYIGYLECDGTDDPSVPHGNSGLLEFDGLDSLMSYKEIHISGNANLESIDGIASSLAGASGILFYVEHNDSLLYDHVNQVAAEAGISFMTCGNLDEPTACECIPGSPP